MWYPNFPEQSHPARVPTSRQGLLLAAYMEARKERLALERQVSRSARRSIAREAAASLGALVLRLAEGVSRRGAEEPEAPATPLAPTLRKERRPTVSRAPAGVSDIAA